MNYSKEYSQNGTLVLKFEEGNEVLEDFLIVDVGRVKNADIYLNEVQKYKETQKTITLKGNVTTLEFKENNVILKNFILKLTQLLSLDSFEKALFIYKKDCKGK